MLFSRNHLSSLSYWEYPETWTDSKWEFYDRKYQRTSPMEFMFWCVKCTPETQWQQIASKLQYCPPVLKHTNQWTRIHTKIKQYHLIIIFLSINESCMQFTCFHHCCRPKWIVRAYHEHEFCQMLLDYIDLGPTWYWYQSYVIPTWYLVRFPAGPIWYQDQAFSFYIHDYSEQVSPIAHISIYIAYLQNTAGHAPAQALEQDSNTWSISYV